MNIPDAQEARELREMPQGMLERDLRRAIHNYLLITNFQETRATCAKLLVEEAGEDALQWLRPRT